MQFGLASLTNGKEREKLNNNSNQKIIYFLVFFLRLLHCSIKFILICVVYLCFLEWLPVHCCTVPTLAVNCAIP